MKPIAESQLWRQQFGDILIIAILLGTGIGLLTTSISEVLKSEVELSAALGGFLVLASLFLTLRSQRKRRSDVLRLRGALAFEVRAGEIKPLRIYGYELNNEFCSNLVGFLSENAAYKKKFISHFEDKDNSPKSNDDTTSRKRSTSYEFFRETVVSVVEFVLLNELDLHLNAYFVNNEIDTATIKKIGREDLPLSVLSNKVIDTLTKHYSEREAFIDSDFDESIGELYYATGKDGAVYNRLSVELPPDSTISRTPNGALRIRNKNFDLSLLVKFEGNNAYVHSDLMEETDDDLFSPYSVGVNIAATASPPMFQRSKANEIYAWLDSYIDRIEKLVSLDLLEAKFDPELREFMIAKSRKRRS